MDRSELDARFQFALDLIREAGALALNYFGKRKDLTIKSKGMQDLASEADLETELLIRRKLEARWPDDAFLGEETGTSDYRPEQGIWVVDPIDGTQPFICGMSSWCVSIAFVLDGTLRFGAVFAPARDELFAGGEGFPAMLNGEPVERSAAEALNQGITGFGYSPRVSHGDVAPVFERLLEANGTFYRDGSGALSLCYVAAGRLIGYIEPHINSWDCLGAVAVIRAAGLQTSDFLQGDALHEGNWLVAGAPAVYGELHRVLKG
ncbi:MAG: inositol monophosphatase [Methylobacterium mesophilicum]|nr:inositol monophosphatase [Methylobacterium mesophilicum]